MVSSRNLQGFGKEKVENLHFRPAKSRDIINQYSELRILQGRLSGIRCFTKSRGFQGADDDENKEKEEKEPSGKFQGAGGSGQNADFSERGSPDTGSGTPESSKCHFVQRFPKGRAGGRGAGAGCETLEAGPTQNL